MLSQTCEYALRALTYIAQHNDEGLVLARDIAKHTNVPHKYLQKVLSDLVRSRTLTSTRGIGGGFRLNKPPGEVRLIDVMSLFDDVLAQTNCPFGNPECGVSNPCPVHDRWVDVVTAYKGFLETTTLKDLVRDRVTKAPKRKGPRKAGRKKTKAVRTR